MKRERTLVRLHFWRLIVALAHCLAGPFVSITAWAEMRLTAVETELLNRENEDGGDA